MLVQFSVENYLSFKGETVLNMTATTDTRHKEHVKHDENGKNVSLLHSAALYGANASGKSNLVKAMDFARNLIINGTGPGNPLQVVPFKLDKESSRKHSKFEFIIKNGETLYKYGFFVNDEKVIEEWLFVDSGKREVNLFDRITDDSGKVTVEIGSRLAPKGSKQAQFLFFIAKGTRPNQLFLTEAYEKNVDEIKSLVDWFKDVLTVVKPEQERFTFFPLNLPPEKYSIEDLMVRVEEEPGLLDFIHSFFATAMKEINKLYVYKRERTNVGTQLSKYLDGGRNIDEKTVNKKAEKAVKEVVRSLYTIHKNPLSENGRIVFSIKEESDGTQRLIQLLPVIFDAVTKGKVFVIDEIERSLHPLLSRLFLETYLNSKPCGGQIIFTTHETTLLDLDLLRRDEIWFAEKDEEESSKIYSLAEFRVRNDLKIDKGYLNGRFGAIPFFGDTSRLGVETESKKNVKPAKKK